MISLDRAFQALADPARRGILEQLSRRPCTVSELAQPLGLSLPAVGHHLRMLEGGGLIRSEKQGRVRTCHIEPQPVLEIERWIPARRNDWERRLNRLGAWLEATESPPSSQTKRKKRR